MRSSIIAATAVVLAGLNMVNGQTFTDCDPTKKTCAANPGLGTTITTDFTKQSADWKEADGTKLKYGPNGAEFTIDAKTDAPTIGTNKYIMFGKVSVTMKASPGTGTVSSFILESDDLDEIDWEWLGSTDTSVESNFFGKGNTTTYDRAIYHDVADPINTYITYTIDWTKDAVKWYIGDKLVRTLAYNDPKTLGGYNYPQTPMRVKMGSWIGCLDAAAAADPKSKGTCDWAGGYIDLTKGPFTMYVKSTTIQDYGCGGDYTYSDMTGTYQSIKSSGTCDGKADDTPASSSSAKPSTSASASASSSATSKTGGVLIETASGVSTVSSSTSASAASTTSAKASSTLATTTAVAPTTSASSTSAVAPSATTSSALAQQTTSGSSSVTSQHKYGVLDITVVALGLGLGYLVM